MSFLHNLLIFSLDFLPLLLFPAFDLVLFFYFVNRKLEVQLPRFLLEHSYTLKDVLQTLDIAMVFQDDADLSNLGRTKLTQVSEANMGFF